jgi:hypothetical protein
MSSHGRRNQNRLVLADFAVEGRTNDRVHIHAERVVVVGGIQVQKVACRMCHDMVRVV